MSLEAIAETLAEQTLLETVTNLFVGLAVTAFFILYWKEIGYFLIYGALLVVLITAPLFVFAPFLLASPVAIVAPLLLIVFAFWFLSQ